MNTDDFLQKMNRLQDKNTLKSTNLEEFLRALWGQIINTHKESAPTWELFVTLFEKAWIANPVPFDEAWFKITESAVSSEYTIDEEGDYIPSEEMEDFQFLQHQILYQIADLRRMRDAGYFERDGMELYMGVTSPTGASWYNFSIPSFLEAAFGLTYEANAYTNLDEATWRDLGELLYMGQIYE